MGDEPPRPPPLRRRGRQGSALTLRIPWVAGLQGPVVGTGRLAVLRIRTAALMPAPARVTSVGHNWGSRAKDSRGHEYRADDSRNNPFVAVVAGGEGNHSWHHADPACPRHGRRVVLDTEAVAAGAKPDRSRHPDAT